MAPRGVEQSVSNDVPTGAAGLIDGDFDIESLIAELTIEEKSSLLSGTAAVCALATTEVANNA